MKTVKTITAGIILMASVFAVNASENLRSSEVRIHVAEYEMKIEPWMVAIETFELKKPETSAGTVVDIAVANSDFSILVEAVTKAGLAGALSAEGPFTVFAPTNEAFNVLFKQLGVS